MKKIIFAALILSAAAGFAGCSSDDGASDDGSRPELPEPPGADGEDPAGPTIDPAIEPWSGEKADDAALDVVGDDADFYWEAPDNDFSQALTVVYDGATASVSGSVDGALTDVAGAYVTIDLKTNSVKGVEIVVRGRSDDGGLKIYGDKKFKLTLAGAELTSTRGPAINNQCKKRLFVHLEEGSTNRLTDAVTYGDDFFYPEGVAADDEDRKGCLFSEGSLLVSGTGVLVVEGRHKHAVATDGYFRMRPGATIAVTGAAKNALHVKGDADDGIGVHIAGGLFYAHTSATAGKCIKMDLGVEIGGGKLQLNTSGGSEYDAEENDTSSAACIKADGDVLIRNGELTLKSTGTGGKGINADGALTLDGGVTKVSTSGGKYIYDAARDLTSSPKGVKADGEVVVNGGELYVSVTGVSDGSEGLESKTSITINDGVVDCYAYDDAINASNAVAINGGRVYACSVANDGIDSNGTITVTGGVVIASGSTRPEEGFDCDNNTFRITGGVVVGTGGATSSPTSGVCTQRSVIWNGIRAEKEMLLCIRDGEGRAVLIYELPRTMSGMCLLFSSPDLAQGATYEVLTDGTATGTAWNGWYSDAVWSGGTRLGSFTASGMVTTVGNSGGGGGGGRPW